MRTAILIVLTLGLLAGGFVVYYLIQPPAVPYSERSTATDAPSTAPVFGDNGTPLGAGRDVWVKSYSNEGELASEFTAARYDPQKDGTVLVERPRAKFHLRNGQYILLTGDRGVVTVPQTSKVAPSAAVAGSTRMQAPTRGELHDVAIYLYDALDAQAPTLTVELNNAAFDNESFRIHTEAYTVDGKLIAADRVPVRVYGEDIEFAGAGLTIRWNEIERRLEELEVAHGELLVLRHPGRFGQRLKSSSSADAAPRSPGPALAVADDSLIAEALPASIPANSGNSAKVAHAGNPADGGNPPGRADHAAPQTYQAEFLQQVRILRNDQLVATGDRLAISLTLKNAKSPATVPSADPTPSTAPLAAAPNSSPTTSSPTASPAIPSSTGLSSTTSPAPAAPVGPLSGDEPITVRWTGPLRVTPAQGDLPPSGQSIVTMTGAPLLLQQDVGRLTGSSLRYETATGTAILTGDDAFPVILRDAQGTEVRTRQLEHVQSANIAILRGASHATLPIAAGGNAGARETLDASWNDACTLHFVAAIDGALAIDHAELTGKVAIDHPQMALAADSLALDFATAPSGPPARRPTASAPATGPSDSASSASRPVATGRATGPSDSASSASRPVATGRATDPTDSAPPATAPTTAPATRPALPSIQLRRAVAQGAVHATFRDKTGRDQTLTADRLDLSAAPGPDGRLIPRDIRADGHVVATLPDQRFSAGHIELTLAPPPAAPAGGQPADAARMDSATAPSVHPRAANDPAPSTPAPSGDAPLAGAGHPAAAPSGDAPLAGAGHPAPEPSGNSPLAASGHPAAAPSRDPSPAGALADSALRIERLIARDDVRLSSADASATADEVRLDTDSGRRTVTFRGQPAAKLSSKDAILSGPVIILQPDDARAEIQGPGSLQTSQKSTPDAVARPVLITWTDAATLDAAANTGWVTGAVRVQSADPDGMVQSITAKKLQITLADAAATRPATPPVNLPDTPPAPPVNLPAAPSLTTPAVPAVNLPTAPSVNDPAKTPVKMPRAAAGDNLALLRGKQIQSVTFTDAVELRAEARRGDILERGLTLQSEVLIYAVAEQRLSIPRAGRMLYEDHRPTASTRPAGADLAGADFSQARGMTAVAWTDELTVDQRDRNAVLRGAVRVVHEPQGAGADQRIQLDADRIDLAFAPAANAPGGAPSSPSTGGAPNPSAVAGSSPATQTEAGSATATPPVPRPSSAMTLAGVVSQGSVYFKARGLEFRADRVSVDPPNHLLVATGAPDHPAQLLDATGLSSGAFSELRFDTRSQQILSLKDVQAIVRPQ